MGELQSKEKQINGYQVRVVPLLGTRSFSVHAKFLKFFGKPLLQALGAIKDIAGEASKSGKKVDLKSVMGTEIDFSLFSEAMESLVAADADALLVFVMDAMGSTFINERAVDKSAFDMLFAGNMVFMYKVLWFTLEVNYGDFFAVVGTGNTSQSRPAPTGNATQKSRSA
jgi:hypothetical protein